MVSHALRLLMMALGLAGTLYINGFGMVRAEIDPGLALLPDPALQETSQQLLKASAVDEDTLNEPSEEAASPVSPASKTPTPKAPEKRQPLRDMSPTHTDLTQREPVRKQTAQASVQSAPQAISYRQYENYLTSFITNYNRKLNEDEARAFARTILQFSEKYNLDFRLVTSIIAVESSFRENAISPTGAIGLGQLKPATAQWLGVRNPYNPEENIYGVTKYLRYLLDTFEGNLDKSVSAYYVGPGTVSRNGIVPSAHPYLLKVSNVLSRF